MKTRIMYIEDKSSGLSGPARIGRVEMTKLGKTIHYRGRTFRTLRGTGFKANYCDVETGEEFWYPGHVGTVPIVSTVSVYQSRLMRMCGRSIGLRFDAFLKPRHGGA